MIEILFKLCYYLSQCPEDMVSINFFYAEVMELADVTDSKSVVSDHVRVRVPPSAPLLLP